MFNFMRAKPKTELMQDPQFTQKLYVLLMIYYNLVR